MKPYACNNLPREPEPLAVQDGWLDIPHEYSHERRAHFTTRRPLMRDHVAPFDTATCRYDKRATDGGCMGCKWQGDASQ